MLLIRIDFFFKLSWVIRFFFKLIIVFLYIILVNFGIWILMNYLI